MPLALADLYDAKVSAGELRADPAQRAVLGQLEALRGFLEAQDGRPRGGLRGLFSRAPEPPKGLYLWGGVGRGKSMLMDLFYHSLAIGAKRRVHFHAFMQEIHRGHARGAQARASRTRWPRWPSAVAQSTAPVSAFDEMQITDITDAMIVGRLFEMLFDAGRGDRHDLEPPARGSLQGRAEPRLVPALHRTAATTGWRWWNWKARPTTASTAWPGAQVYFTPAGQQATRPSRRSGPT